MAPEPVSGRLVLAAPPRPEPREGLSGLLVMAIPMLGSLGSIVVVTTMNGTHADGRQYVAAGMFVLATVGFVVVQADRQRAQRRDRTGGSRAAYARHLSSARPTIREAAREQQRQLRRHHPDPAALPTWAAEGTRVWERGPADPLFLHVRWGLADQPLALELVPPEESATDAADPASAAALERLLAVHRVVPDCPVTVDLRSVGRLAVAGDRALARAVVCSAAAPHAPDHLAVAVLATREHLAHWDWLKWLPHSLSPAHVDAVGPARMVATSLDELRRRCCRTPRTSCSCWTVSTAVGTTNARGRRCSTWPRTATCPAPDRCSLPVAEAFARRLTARAPTPGGRRSRGVVGAARGAGACCGCPSARRTTASRSSSTSRSPRSRAWARTGWSSAPPGPASPNCCAPSCCAWPRRTRPSSSTWCWSTSRAVRPSPGWPDSRTCPR